MKGGITYVIDRKCLAIPNCDLDDFYVLNAFVVLFSSAFVVLFRLQLVYLICSILLMFLECWLKIGFYCFVDRYLAIFYLGYLKLWILICVRLLIRQQDEKSQVFTSLLLYSILFLAYLLVICF